VEEHRLWRCAVAVESSTHEIRALHLSAYVDRSLDAIMATFVAPEIDELLAGAVRAALEVAGERSVETHASAPEWVSSSHVRVPVSWRATRSSGQIAEGVATLSLLVVRTGHDAVTELLVTLPLSREAEDLAVTTMHRVVDEITARLERAAG
jgi:hypothetical protein